MPHKERSKVSQKKSLLSYKKRQYPCGGWVGSVKRTVGRRNKLVSSTLSLMDDNWAVTLLLHVWPHLVILISFISVTHFLHRSFLFFYPLVF